MAILHPKKVAAVIAAVLQHAAESEFAVTAPAAVCAAAQPGPVPPLWAWAGRQEAMHDRVSWQRRLSRSW